MPDQITTMFHGAMLQEMLARNAAAERDKWDGFAYSGPADFVLREGVFYCPRPWPKNRALGARQQCFGNAMIRAATESLLYVEGFALTDHGSIHIHAWNADRPGGELIDSTWGNQGIAYMGVAFAIERADEATWTGDACVLDDRFRGYPIFRESWTGEKDWPPSERIEAWRSRDQKRIDAMLYLMREEVQSERANANR